MLERERKKDDQIDGVFFSYLGEREGPMIQLKAQTLVFTEKHKEVFVLANTWSNLKRQVAKKKQSSCQKINEVPYWTVKKKRRLENECFFV